MKLIKLTDQDGFTTNHTKWRKNVTHKATGMGKVLCTADVIHAYEDARIAVVMNPVHGNFLNPIGWEAEADEIVASDGLKVGVKTLTTIRRVALPKISLTQQVAFGILSAMVICMRPQYQTWAKNWLSGKDRSRESAAAYYAAASYAANTTAANAAASNATYAAANAAASPATKKINFIRLMDEAMKIK